MAQESRARTYYQYTQKMKKLISSEGGINTYLEVKPIENNLYSNWRHIRLTTTYEGSKNPSEEHIKFDWCIEPDSFNTFKEFINEV